MKYKFVLQQIAETEDEDPFSGRSFRRDRAVDMFSADIDAEEMVELMQVTWQLANRRAKRVVT